VSRYGGKIEIGEGFGISGSTIYSTSSITIGKNATIGANCKIVDNDFHPLCPEKRRMNLNKEYTKRAPVKIGDNCFIGMNSIILKGTTIGDNVVVGAGSVVSGQFPDNCIIAGNPAKIIKYI
jgi:acetyltransferase-like isoleucine patch superfamily enzyme